MPDQLRHGYTMEDLQHLARAATFTARGKGTNQADRLETAWSAVAEALYSSTEPPTPGDLLRAAWKAVNRSVSEERHHHGSAPGDDLGVVRPGFLKYWLSTIQSPDPERVAVEHLALRQIWPRLTRGERRALAALAEYEDYAAAAASLGITYHGLAKQVRTGRLKFLALWHEGEPPSRVWCHDRRARHQAADPDRPRASVMARRKRAVRGRQRRGV